MFKNNFNLEHNFNNLRKNSYLRITRIFLFCSSIMYCKWGYLATKYLDFSNEAWWVRPIAVIPALSIFALSYKLDYIKKHLPTFSWLAVNWIFLNYIYFIMYKNNANLSSIIGLFIVLFGTGMFLRNNKELWLNALVVMPCIYWVFENLNQAFLVDDTMVILSMFTNYFLISIFLYAKNYFIGKTEESYKNLKVLIDAGSPTVLTHKNQLIYGNDKFLKEFTISNNEARFIDFSKIYHSNKKQINGIDVSIDMRNIVLNGKKLKLYIFKDIRLELKNKEKNRQVSQMKSMREITGNLAHEINNPLMILKMTNESLSFTESEEEREELISRADETIERMRRTMVNLKLLAKDVSNEVESHFFIEKAIEELFDIVKFRLDQFDIKYEIVSDIKDSVSLKKYHLFQVLLNLVNNSIDSLSGLKKEDKRIIIRVLKVGDLINFIIEDNGKGISDKDQYDIFKPFFSNKKIGTGMGLTIAKDLLTDVGGELKLNESSSKKTVFTFSLKNKSN